MRRTTIAFSLAALTAALASSSAIAGTVCPAVGAATAGAVTGCNLIITIAANNVATVGPGDAGGPGVFDFGGDDTLIGVINNSPNPVSSLFLSSPSNPIFGFDGDGLTFYGVTGNLSDPTGYGGPDAFFTGFSGPLFRSGTVNFITAIAANGGTQFFGLEDRLTAASFTPPVVGGVPEPSTWAMMLLGFLGLGFAFRRSRRKLSFA
jgi:hypothetical protein